MKSTPESRERKPFDSYLILIALIFALALFLRISGIGWGLPNEHHKFSYHPDELPLLSAALRVTEGNYNPAFFNYPSFYIYLTSFSIVLASAWGLVSSLRDIYLVARIVVVLMGAGSVFLAYYAGKRWYGKGAGLVAALIMAVVPLSVVHSHYATVDVPAAFWVTACIAAASTITHESKGRTYLLAGLLAGFAAGTKYNAGVVILVPFVAGLVQSQISGWRKLADPKLWLIPLAAIAGFIITTPGVILWRDDFLRGFGYELWHAGSGHGFVFTNAGPGWLFTFTSSFLHGFGVPLAVSAIVAVAYAFIKREKADWPLLAFFICYYLLISFSEVRFSRYALPLVPVAAILIGRLMAINISNIARPVWYILTVLLIAHTLSYSVALDRLFAGPDPRDQALHWAENNVEKQLSIGLASVPWFYTPPFADGFGSLRREERLRSAAESKYYLVTAEHDWDTSVLDETPDYVVLSDYEKLDAVRARDASALRFVSGLLRNYQLMKTLGDRGLYKVNPPFIRPQELPHDMKYMNPTIWIYKGKQDNG